MKNPKNPKDPKDPVELSQLGRFADPAVLILSSLAGGDKHGYALVKDIESFASVRLGPGTLYGALTRLEQRGMVEALAADDRRRPYRITPRGAAALEAYLRHARAVTDVGLRRLAQA
jgi:DNA-binding PadR family transcriptional regulator